MSSEINGFMEIVGLIAGACTTLAYLPQVLKIYRSKSVKDISFSMYTMLCSGLILWIIYGIAVRSLPIVLANIVTFFLAGSVLIMKIKWRK